MDSRRDPRLERGHRSVDVGETPGNLYFELGISQMCRRCDPSQNIARDQTQHDPVRVVDDDHIVDLKAQLRSGRPSCLNRAAKFRWLHTAPLPLLGPVAPQRQILVHLGEPGQRLWADLERPLLFLDVEGPFIWVDDEISAMVRQWVAAGHPGPSLLHRVGPSKGLLAADFAPLADWLRAVAP
jgi:hypothetical protein